MARSGTSKKTRCGCSANCLASFPRNARRRTGSFFGTAISWRNLAISTVTTRFTASAKSFLSTAASIAVAKGLIRSVDDRVADYINDGGYDSPHNAKITWKNHLQQESEWEGEMWGKNANFLGAEEFGSGQRQPREIHDPGTYYEYNDVRINRFALSLARVFGRGVPEVFKEDIMDRSALPTNGSGMVMVQNRP